MQTVFASDGVKAAMVTPSVFNSNFCCSDIADISDEKCEAILVDIFSLFYLIGRGDHARHSNPRSIEIPAAELCTYVAHGFCKNMEQNGEPPIIPCGLSTMQHLLHINSPFTVQPNAP